MAYIVIVAEGDASDVVQTTWREKSKRLRTHTQTPGALVVYDTNLARDVKGRISSGKLVVFRCDEPHDLVELGGAA
jgi:hypothetical protein